MGPKQPSEHGASRLAHQPGAPVVGVRTREPVCAHPTGMPSGLLITWVLAPAEPLPASD